MNQELRSNLEAIQGEVDSMFMIACVVEEIAKENKINLNTATVNKWLAKLTNYIALIAGPDAMKSINENRVKFQEEYLQGRVGGRLPQDDLTKTTTTQRNTRFNKVMTFFNRTLAPGEYLRVLVRDVIILHIFFTIMMSEFDLFMRAKGDTTNKTWITSPAYKLLLATNKAFVQKVIQKDFNEQRKKEYNAQFAEFYGSPTAQSGGDNNEQLIQELLTPELVKGATKHIEQSTQVVTAVMNSPEIKEKFKQSEQEEKTEVVQSLLIAGIPVSNVADATDAITAANNENKNSNPGEVASGGGRRRTRKYRAKKNNRRN